MPSRLYSGSTNTFSARLIAFTAARSKYLLQLGRHDFDQVDMVIGNGMLPDGPMLAPAGINAARNAYCEAHT